MQAGQLRDRVVILKKSTTPDSQGGRSTTWVDLVTDSAITDRQTRLAANVDPMETRERLQAAAIGATLMYAVTIRYRRDVTEKMRVLWTPYGTTTEKTLEVHGVTPVDGKRAYVRLDCSELI
jgi:SPP1 family predicted phage head-tail adaptor